MKRTNILAGLFVVCSLVLNTSATEAQLFDPGFEAPLTATYFQVLESSGPGTYDAWGAENGLMVNAENGITPFAGTGMLRLNPSGGNASQAAQRVDVSSFADEIDAGQFEVTVGALFNVTATAPGSQAAIANVTLHYIDGIPSPPGSNITISDSLGTLSTADLIVDNNPNTWESIDPGPGFAPIGTRSLLVEFLYRNASLVDVNQGYVDNASLSFRTCFNTSTSLSTLLENTMPVCSGDKTFSDFTYSPIGDMPLAEDIIVHPISRVDPNTGEENFGIRFQGAFVDSSSGAASDALIEYKVEAPDGKLIKDVHMQANPLVIGGNGVMSVTETFLPENDDTVLSVFDIQPGSRKLQDWADLVDENGMLKPEKSLHVQKDILAWAQEPGAVATMSFIDQTFSQCDEDDMAPGVCVVPGGEIVDFNGDASMDQLDIDMLTAAIRSMVADAEYDLDGSGAVDFADLAYMVEAELETYLGDANLDGVVDVTDYQAWSAAKFTEGTGWATGDFNGDGFTDGSDFSLWSQSRHQGVSSVPEPASICLVLTALALLTRYRRVNWSRIGN